MERVKSNVGKGFGWENPINSMDAGCLWVHEGCQIRLGEGIWMGKSYKLDRCEMFMDKNKLMEG